MYPEQLHLTHSSTSIPVAPLTAPTSIPVAPLTAPPVSQWPHSQPHQYPSGPTHSLGLLVGGGQLLSLVLQAAVLQLELVVAARQLSQRVLQVVVLICRSSRVA